MRWTNYFLNTLKVEEVKRLFGTVCNPSISVRHLLATVYKHSSAMDLSRAQAT